MEKHFQATSEISVIPGYVPIPLVGWLPVNSFVMKGREPMLIDTGLAMDRQAFMGALEAIVDPADLRWVVLTHDDADHTGSIQAVMERAPQAKLLVHGLAALRMLSWWPVPLERVRPLNPGDRIDVGDRVLAAFRPPLFDNPLSVGLYDDKSGAMFSADSFGALLAAPIEDAAQVPESELAGGMVAWGTGDSPWVHMTEESKYQAVLDQVRKIDPRIILSSHLPPARGITGRLLSTLATLRNAEPAMGPTETQFQAMLAQMRQGT